MGQATENDKSIPVCDNEVSFWKPARGFKRSNETCLYSNLFYYLGKKQFFNILFQHQDNNTIYHWGSLKFKCIYQYSTKKVKPVNHPAAQSYHKAVRVRMQKKSDFLGYTTGSGCRFIYTLLLIVGLIWQSLRTKQTGTNMYMQKHCSRVIEKNVCTASNFEEIKHELP